MTFAIHQKWAAVNVALIGNELSARLGAPSLDLIHAWGNLIYADDTHVYKLTRPEDKSRCESALRTLSSLLAAQPDFPTVHPVSRHAQDIKLGPSGAWVMTIWPRLRLVPVLPSADDAKPYRELGQVLRLLHSTEVQGCSRHDPLVWAVARANSVPDLDLRESLLEEAQHLAQRYQTEFPATLDVTVHGDLHWEQVARDENGRLLLLDFEHVATGPACIDLIPSAGWLRRTGQPSEAQTAALAAGYGSSLPSLTEPQALLLGDIARFSRRTWDLLS